jgi:hypothetical protein
VGVLLLVRHGQGSMGTADYDQLSELATGRPGRPGPGWPAPT